MKNIYEILKDYGLEIPEEKKADIIFQNLIDIFHCFVPPEMFY